MTNLFYPDRAQFQGQTSFQAHAVAARATEGDWLTDPAYAFNLAEAHRQSAIVMAYHFLEDGSPAKSQAAHCHSIVGNHVPLMLDFEPIASTSSAEVSPETAATNEGDGWWCGSSLRLAVPGMPNAIRASSGYISKPGLSIATSFIDAYRQLGGVCHVVYLPHWYHQVLGSPSLKPLADRHMILVSSNYTAYSDTGPGWDAYGGMSPRVWQYTDAGPGAQDWNAYRSNAATVHDAVDELEQLWATGTLSGKTWQTWETKGAKSLQQVADSVGMSPARILRVTATHYKRFDDVTAGWLNGVFAGTVPVSDPIPAGAKLRVLR